MVDHLISVIRDDLYHGLFNALVCAKHHAGIDGNYVVEGVETSPVTMVSEIML
jgi:hypothetical protein